MTAPLMPVDIYYKNRATGEIGTAQMTRYPDGTPMLKCDAVPDLILCRTPYVAHFMAMLWWVDALRDRGHIHMIDLILPTVIGSRQDRLMGPGGDQLFTLKGVAMAINSRRFGKVIVIDPHSDVTPGLIDRCQVVTAANCLTLLPELPDVDVVIGPDAGAAKRAEGVAKLIKKPFVQAWKTRNPATGELSGFGCEPLPAGAKRALLVDDLCDAGGTFLGLANELRKRGEIYLDLYVTHGFFTKGLEALAANFTRIYTTDSVIAERNHKQLTVIPVASEILLGAQ